ncbi:MAG: histidine phosphatase family protein [Geminicoccaceae bacterium]
MMMIRHAQSEWNHHFSKTRVDPGIPDPSLTALGRQQAADLIGQLRGRGLAKLVASPFRRTLETAMIVAEALDLPISVNSLVRERCCFSCDIGSEPEALSELCPSIDFSGLERGWWGQPPESEEQIQERCTRFRSDHHDLLQRQDIAIITHWGFIRAFTGEEVANAAIVRISHDLSDGILPTGAAAWSNG